MPEQEFDPVDLVHPAAVFVNRLPDMTTVRERIFRQFKNKLFQETRRNIRSSEERFEIISHDEYLSNKGSYNVYGVINISPIKGYSLITIDGELLAALVDDMFGAEDGQRASIAKLISGMERRIGHKLIKILVEALDDSLQQYFPSSTSIVRTEEYVALASVSDAAEPFCILSTMLALPTGAGKLSIGIPYRGLEPFREVLGAPAGGANYHETDLAWGKQIDACIDSVPVAIGVEIARHDVSTSLIEQLKIGDIIPLHLHKHAKLVVGAQTITEVSYGAVDGHYGVCFNK
jgi:flagellar motor switch protein FliM